MFCTQCGRELKEDDRFCSGCGQRLNVSAPPPEHPRLMLDKANKKVAGVCAGFARYFDTDVTLMRVLWLGIALCTGVGFLVYLGAWMILPSDRGIEAERALVRV